MHDLILEEINNNFFDAVESSRSLLYGSNAFYSIKDGTGIYKKFEGMFSKVDKLYSDIHNKLKSNVSSSQEVA